MRNKLQTVFQCFVIIILVGFSNQAVANQNVDSKPKKSKKSIFYPETNRIPYTGVSAFKYHEQDVYTSGEQLVGKGKKLVATEIQASTVLYEKSLLGYTYFDWIIVEFTFYDGVFGDGTFEGKVSVVEVRYEVDLNAEKQFLVPVRKVNFETGLDDAGVYNLVGTINTKIDRRYDWRHLVPINAKAYGVDLLNFDGGAYSSSYIDGKQGVTTVDFPEGSISKITGIENMHTNSLAYGTIDYRNGERFDGFFANNKIFGPGILFNADKTVSQSGFWDESNLLFPSQLHFPEQFVNGLMNIESDQTGWRDTLLMSKKCYVFNLTKASGLFIAADRSFYGYGKILDSKLEGYAFMMKDTSYFVKYDRRFGGVLSDFRAQCQKQEVTFGVFEKNKLTEGASKVVSVFLRGGTFGPINVRQVATRVGKFDQNQVLNGCGYRHAEDWTVGYVRDTLILAEFKAGKPDGLYKKTTFEEKTQVHVTQTLSSKSQELEPDALYSYIQLERPNKCSGVSLEDLNEYTAELKIRSDRWIATTDMRAETKRRVDTDNARDSTRRALVQQSCERANDLVGYRTKRNGVVYIIVDANSCIGGYMTVLDDFEDPVGTYLAPITEALECEPFGEYGHVEYCQKCNGFGLLYENNRSKIIKPRFIVEKWTNGNVSYYNYTYHPDEWTPLYCDRCEGAKYLWIKN